MIGVGLEGVILCVCYGVSAIHVDGIVVSARCSRGGPPARMSIGSPCLGVCTHCDPI
jgi:hypothetical protein|eukprot:COSAG01_NODE_498_length_16259_cov_11.917512_29_plen_57_part_00